MEKIVLLHWKNFKPEGCFAVRCENFEDSCFARKVRTHGKIGADVSPRISLPSAASETEHWYCLVRMRRRLESVLTIWETKETPLTNRERRKGAGRIDWHYLKARLFSLNMWYSSLPHCLSASAWVKPALRPQRLTLDSLWHADNTLVLEYLDCAAEIATAAINTWQGKGTHGFSVIDVEKQVRLPTLHKQIHLLLFINAKYAFIFFYRRLIARRHVHLRHGAFIWENKLSITIFA